MINCNAVCTVHLMLNQNCGMVNTQYINGHGQKCGQCWKGGGRCS